MNILVTGGAGFIGSHTVIALSEAGFTPIIVDDFSNSNHVVLRGIEKILGQKPRYYPDNCHDAEVLRRIFREKEIGGVIHFAAFKAVGESMREPLKYYANNIGSLIVLLETMLEFDIPNIIFSSSATVYGEPETLPVTEDSRIPPAESVYGNTKQIGEEIIRDTAAAGKPLKGISLRYFNPIGAHPSAYIGELPIGVPNNLVPFITQTAVGLRPALTVFGNNYPTPDGTCVRDFIHVMDLAEAHVAALKYLINHTAPTIYEVYNVGTGHGNSVMEIIQLFEAVSGQRLNYRIGERRAGDVAAVYADVSKIEQQLGWTAQRTLREALEDAWRWQQTLGIGN
ncbi:MAG: UDP-glucose 4-epimerase GalE [Haliscomenobacteraceae bacterium CHB4]|nr:UDP-glucose 4-epimerase [Saprospiraceae bacterium]MCE7923557.1 UDP-glucose 4-epimerase GalE [Haliscomenobacteraceae bacterium CHB4]